MADFCKAKSHPKNKNSKLDLNFRVYSALAAFNSSAIDFIYRNLYSRIQLANTLNSRNKVIVRILNSHTHNHKTVLHKKISQQI